MASLISSVRLMKIGLAVAQKSAAAGLFWLIVSHPLTAQLISSTASRETTRFKFRIMYPFCSRRGALGFFQVTALFGRFGRSAATHGVSAQQHQQDRQCHQRPGLQALDNHGSVPAWCFFSCAQAMYAASITVATPNAMRTIEPDVK